MKTRCESYSEMRKYDKWGKCTDICRVLLQWIAKFNKQYIHMSNLKGQFESFEHQVSETGEAFGKKKEENVRRI